MKSQLSFIYHILDEISFIESHILEKGLEKRTFLDDEVSKRAFARSIEIIGEAVKSISSEIYHQYPHIPWRKIAGMRDRLIHGYFSVDYDLVWDVVVNHLPPLKDQLEQIIASEN